MPLLLLLTLTVCCRHPIATDCLAIDEHLLQEGDLVFRLGRGTSSRIVNMADAEKSYSHIGLLVRDSSVWYVLHAVPGESNETAGREVVKKDSLSRFFGYDRTISGVVMRFDSIRNVADCVLNKAKLFFEKQLFFDHNYKLSDSTKLYCTELVYRAFLCSGTDLSEGRRHTFPLFKERIIFPSDLLKNRRLKKVCEIRFVEQQ